MDGQLTGRVLKFGEIDSHGSVFQADSFPNDNFPLDVQLNLLHSEDKRDVIGRATINKNDDGLDYVADFFTDARSQLNRQNILDYPEKLQVSLEASPIEAENNADGITFYRSANITGLAVVFEGSAPSASVETKRGIQQMAEIVKTPEQIELEKIQLEIKREELSQAKAKTIKLEAENELATAKQAEIERAKLGKAGAGENWLDTDEALLAFGNALLEQDGSTPFKELWRSITKQNTPEKQIERQAKQFGKTWKKALVTRGISGFQAPSGFLEKISQAFDEYQTFWDLLDHTGLQTLQVGNTDPVYGNGWENNQASPTKSKTETAIDLEVRQLTPQDIYIYTTIARSTLLLNKDTNAVINFVLNKLPKAVVATAEKAVLVGGNANITSIRAIKGDSWASTSTDVINPREALADIVENIEVDNKIVVAMSKKSYRKLKWETVDGGNHTNQQLVIPFGATKQDIADVFGIARIVTPSYMKDSDDIIGFSAGEYAVVGDTSAETFQDFDLPYNRERFLMEIFAGASIAGKGRAHVATLKKATPEA